MRSTVGLYYAVRFHYSGRTEATGFEFAGCCQTAEALGKVLCAPDSQPVGKQRKYLPSGSQGTHQKWLDRCGLAAWRPGSGLWQPGSVFDSWNTSGHSYSIKNPYHPKAFPCSYRATTFSRRLPSNQPGRTISGRTFLARRANVDGSGTTSV